MFTGTGRKYAPPSPSVSCLRRATDTVISVGLDGCILAWDLGCHAVEVHPTTALDTKACSTMHVLDSTLIIVGTEQGSLVLYHCNDRRFRLSCHRVCADNNQMKEIHAIDGIVAVASRDPLGSTWDTKNLVRYKHLHFNY